MNINEVKEFLNVVKKSNLSSVEIKTNEFYIKVQNDFKDSENIHISSSSEIDYETTDLVSKNEDNSKIELIKAPIVGVFRRENGDKINSIIRVGEKVKKNQIICYIEVMKMINEITCPCDAEILEILVDDEQLVEYGQALFKLKVL